MSDHPPFTLNEAIVAFHEVFLGYQKAGFTESQALYLVGCQVAAASRQTPPMPE